MYKEKAYQKKHYTHSKETKNLEKLINAALRSQDSSANIVTRLRARQRETVFRFPALGEVFSFLKHRNGLWGQRNLQFSGHKGSFSEKKPPVREATYLHLVP